MFDLTANVSAQTGRKAEPCRDKERGREGDRDRERERESDREKYFTQITR